MNKVYIVAAKRTAIGRFLGTLGTSHPSSYGAEVLEDVMRLSGIEGADIDEVIIGNVLPAGQGQGLARQISIKGGIPVEVPAYGVNMVCGSGMKSIMNGYSNIALGLHNLVITGGVESMSMSPFIMSGAVRSGNKLGGITSEDGIISDALTDVFNHYHMGVTAENIAEKHHISRENQDDFALTSQKRAIAAIDGGRFKDEITPVTVKVGRDTVVFDTDEHPNRTSNEEKLAKLKTVFKKDGTVTAGNASGINDGASMMLLASEEAVKANNLQPLAEIIAIGQGGVDPSVMGLGPVPAIAQVLANAQMKLSDMGLIELNEAFAAQSIGVVKELAEAHDLTESDLFERMNVNGGAIALGHPVGVSGNRIVVTLLHEMTKRGTDYGLASLCIGGGMGTAIIVKRHSPNSPK